MKRRSLRGLGLVVAALAVTVLAACQDGEEDAAEPSPTETATASEAASLETAIPATDAPAKITPGPGVTLWRWGNITVLVPDQSGVRPVQRRVGTDETPSGGASLGLRRGDSALSIDSITGEIFAFVALPEDQPYLRSVADTIEVSVDGPVTVWPYEDSANPGVPKREMAGLLFRDPDPASGLNVGVIIIDTETGGYELVEIQSAWSRRIIDPKTAEVITANDMIDPRDAAAFSRWTESVETVNAESP